MKELTARQAECLEFINKTIVERGFPPTQREIGKAMGIKSTNGVNDHLVRLRKKGYLTKESNRARAIQVSVAFTHQGSRT